MPIASLEQMRTFAEVAARGSFAAAARELGVSPSAVSKQIRDLEERLGVQLLNRTTRQVTVTEPGQVYLERISAVLDDVEDVEATVRGLHSEPRGTLRVSAPQDFGRLFLCDILGPFGAAHPELRVDIELTDRLVDLVEERFDVVVRIAKPADSTLVVKKLGRCQRLLCAAPAYLEKYGTPQQPGDLESHSCIEYSYLASRGWSFRVGGRSQTIAATGRFRANSGWAMHAMALAGLGIALLPSYMIHDELADGRLVSVLEEYLDADLEVMALQPPGRRTSGKARAFIDFLVERLATERWWKPSNAR